MADAPDDAAWMSRALTLARRQLGRVAPNPSVGCVLVFGHDCIGEGATGPGGRPHAEELALASSLRNPARTTAYVSLEPCSARTTGTPSCTQRLIEAGFARVVIACADPNPAAAHGADLLRAAGIEVVMGVLEAEAINLNAGFFKRLRTGRPLVAIDRTGESFDAECRLEPDETPEQMLDRLGRSGVTRAFARPGSVEAAKLAAQDLLDSA